VGTEQIYNEARRWAAGVVVGREVVAERVRGALADEALRRRAGEIGGRARRAVEAGGSSYEAVGALLEDLLRPGRRSHDGASGRDTRRAADWMSL